MHPFKIKARGTISPPFAPQGVISNENNRALKAWTRGASPWAWRGSEAAATPQSIGHRADRLFIKALSVGKPIQFKI